MIWLSFGTVLCLLALGAKDRIEDWKDISKSLVIVAACLSRLCMFSVFTVMWIYACEVFPTGIRGSGHSIVNAAARVSGLHCMFIVKPRRICLHVTLDNNVQTRENSQPKMLHLHPCSVAFTCMFCYFIYICIYFFYLRKDRQHSCPTTGNTVRFNFYSSGNLCGCHVCLHGFKPVSSL